MNHAIASWQTVRDRLRPNEPAEFHPAALELLDEVLELACKGAGLEYPHRSDALVFPGTRQ